MRKTSFLKFLDNVVGIPIARLLLSPRADRCLNDALFLFIRPGGMGDAVLLIPTIHAVKRRFPGAAIHVLAEKRNAEVFSLCPEIARVFHYEKPTELMSVIRGSYDVVIDTEQWHRLSAVVARFVRAPIAVGFSTNERKKLFTHPIPYSQDDHEIDSFLRLIEPLAGKTSSDLAHELLAVPDKHRAQVELHLRALSSRKIVALFPGGSIAERRWGNERFRSVAQRLSESGYGIVVIGGKTDIRAGEEITTGIPASVNLCGKLKLPETAAVLERAKLLVTGDSGIMHLGYAVGSRIVALFGPGIEKKWAPRSSRAAVINKSLPCSPCTKFGYTPKCPINAECMKRITIDDVLVEAMKLLEQA